MIMWTAMTTWDMDPSATVGIIMTVRLESLWFSFEIFFSKIFIDDFIQEILKLSKLCVKLILLSDCVH